MYREGWTLPLAHVPLTLWALVAVVMQATLGATSFNGQRCTAVKLVMVHEDVKVRTTSLHSPPLDRCPFNRPVYSTASLSLQISRCQEAFVAKLSARISALKSGLPWEDGVLITPLPEENKTDAMSDLISGAPR